MKRKDSGPHYRIRRVYHLELQTLLDSEWRLFMCGFPTRKEAEQYAKDWMKLAGNGGLTKWRVVVFDRSTPDIGE